MILEKRIAFLMFSQILLLIVFMTGSVLSQTNSVYFKKPLALTDCKPESNKIDEKILYEYGAVYLSDDAKLPIKCQFENQTEIDTFVETFKKDRRESEYKFNFGNFYLQPQAKASLEKVFEELGGRKFVARNCNSKPEDCTNGINNDWALRTYMQTKCNWINYSRWTKLTLEECKKRALGFVEIMNIVENDTLFPRMFKAAIPGASQHHLGLAVDVNDKTGKDGLICGDACVDSLEKNGWYRTVRFDRFHYTYLGYPESVLQSKGLKKVRCSDTFTYWVPYVENYSGYKNWECKNVQN